jgi:hypothetical protein
MLYFYEAVLLCIPSFSLREKPNRLWPKEVFRTVVQKLQHDLQSALTEHCVCELGSNIIQTIIYKKISL